MYVNKNSFIFSIVVAYQYDNVFPGVDHRRHETITNRKSANNCVSEIGGETSHFVSIALALALDQVIYIVVVCLCIY